MYNYNMKYGLASFCRVMECSDIVRQFKNRITQASEN